MAEIALQRPPRFALGVAGRVIEVAALIAIVALALWWRVTNLDAYTGSFDEGIRSQQLLLMAAGFRPFRDIFASQGPLLLDLLYPFYLTFGETLVAVRAGVVFCSIVAIVGAWWTMRQAAGPAAGIAAAGMLAFSPSFLIGSRLALAEIPTIAPSLLAIGALLAYRRLADRRWLVLSAACCALAVLIKPMVLHVGAPLAILLLVPVGASINGSSRRWLVGRIAADVALYALVVGGCCALVVALLGPAQVWDNLGAYRGGAGRAAGSVVRENLRLTASIMRGEQFGLFVLSAIGVALGLWRHPGITVALLAWAGAIVGLFAVYGDLADKHIVYLTPPIVLLAAIGVGVGVDGVVDLIRGTPARTLALVRALVGGIGVLAYIAAFPSVYAADRYLLREAPRVEWNRRGGPVDAEISEIVRTNTPSDGWVLSDNPGAAFEARRKVIPYLVDTSGTRVDAGSLTSALAVEYVQRYQPSVIVTWPRRLGKLDAFVQRLPELGYRLDRSYEQGWKVYLRE